MATKEMTTAKAWSTVFGQLKGVAPIATVMIGLFMFAWTAYGKPIVKEVKNNTTNVEDIKFSIAQILLILEKTTDKKIVDEVRKETERFKPKPKIN